MVSFSAHVLKGPVVGLGSSPSDLVNAGGRIYFTASQPGYGREPWTSDGTSDGTILLKDVCGGGFDSFTGQYTPWNRLVAFSVYVAASRWGLLTTDGTASGTSLLKMFSAQPWWLARIGATLYFAGTGVDGPGMELWRSDGTAAGTLMVKDINAGIAGSYPHSPVDFHGVLYFSANDGQHGGELWRSDGTADGTVMVKDIIPDSIGSIPEALTVFGNIILFVASDGASGEELWRSDGTADGTFMLKDINPGGSSNIAVPTVVGSYHRVSIPSVVRNH